MIKPNLSLEALTSSLAVLAAGTLVVACAASPAPSPVSAQEVPAQQGQKAASPAGHASCSAAGCSANAKGPEVSTTSAPAAEAATPASAAPAAPAASAAPATPAAPAVGASPTKVPAKSQAKKPAAGHSSCGAGTCSASK